MMKKQNELSLKQQYQRLTRAKAQALRAGQSTPKLDVKIEKIRVLMNSTIEKRPGTKPSASKYTYYKRISKAPMRGGSFSPK